MSAGCEKKAPTAEKTVEESGAAPENAESATQDSADAQTEESQEKSSGVPGLGEGTDHQQGLLVEAKKAFLTDDIKRAEVLFETLAESEPVSGPQVSASIALAQIYIDSGRAKEAVKLYAELDEAVGELPEIQLVIARALADIGEGERAIQAYQKLIETQPDFVFALLELGQLYAAADQKEEAAKAYYEYEQKIYKLSARLEAADTPPEEQIRVLNIFSLVSDDRASEATIKVLNSPVSAVREQAATVLGQTGAVEAIGALKKMEVEDADPTARLAARGALRELEALELDEEEAAEGPTVVEDEDALPLD